MELVYELLTELYQKQQGGKIYFFWGGVVVIWSKQTTARLLTARQNSPPSFTHSENLKDSTRNVVYFKYI